MTLSLENLVSCETIEKFRIYEKLLRDWNRGTSLVQEDTLLDFDNRHVLDSLQLIPIIFECTFENNVDQIDFHADDYNIYQLKSLFDKFIDNKLLMDLTTYRIKELSIIDVGTGAGFPGMILAMCGFKHVTLCDSNQKKCIFLEEVARQTKTDVLIINDRIEKVNQCYDIILSRACTDLSGLLKAMDKLKRNYESYGIFHKGRSWHEEVDLAQKQWLFSLAIYRSLTSTEGVVMKFNHVKTRT